MSKSKELEKALIGLIGKAESDLFFEKITKMISENPNAAKQKIALAKAFLK